jgi:hypothetical protein
MLTLIEDDSLDIPSKEKILEITIDLMQTFTKTSLLPPPDLLALLTGKPVVS